MPQNNIKTRLIHTRTFIHTPKLCQPRQNDFVQCCAVQKAGFPRVQIKIAWQTSKIAWTFSAESACFSNCVQDSDFLFHSKCIAQGELQTVSAMWSNTSAHYETDSCTLLWNILLTDIP